MLESQGVWIAAPGLSARLLRSLESSNLRLQQVVLVAESIILSLRSRNHLHEFLGLGIRGG